MRTSSQLLLTFLLNAVWQVALIAALASFGAWLLRRSATRYQHWLWVAALCLSVVVPGVAAIRAWPDSVTAPTEISYARELNNPISLAQIPASSDQRLATFSTSSLQLNNEVAFGLLAVIAALLLFRAIRLGQAYRSTREIRRSAVPLERDEAVGAILRDCAKRINVRADRVTVCRSESVAAPVTVGLFRPVIVLPESLLQEADNDLLTSAIGHEFIHVARHDYVLNFLYELLFLPVSFHPAAALMRRRIKQTRELVCDVCVSVGSHRDTHVIASVYTVQTFR